ncbi:Hypothetical predicted protein [Paramuricea clavata]|uniref:Uncharacterized protein n=1 Tax=Paramuricea clavata TaxID=317549 RepID=A0A7D9L4J6_PARCT|nr:Hypothetical predicted protein [Paramuricea clavata]
MENSISKIPNDLPAARKQYQELLEYERKLNKLFRMLDGFIKEGKRGDLTDEYLADLRKRADKTRRNMLADRNALQEKFKELQQDTILQSERNKNVDFKKNPLKLIPKQSPVQKILTAKTTSFPVVSFLKVKLVQIAPMREILRIENVSLLETQELLPFKPTVKRVLSCGIHECIQTMSRGNEGKYSLHVSSETGAPRVSLNFSLSTASSLNFSISTARSLDLPCAFTTTRQRMMLTSTASNIQQSCALEELIPLEQGPGTLLVVKQPSATSWTLPPSSKPLSNCLLINMRQASSLLSAFLSLQQLMRRLDFPCAFTTNRQQMMSTSTASKIQEPHALAELMPLEHGPGTLMVLIKSSAARWNSLSVSVRTLPASRKPPLFPAFLPEDASNCLLTSMPLHTSLVSALSSLQQLMRRELPSIMDLPLVRALRQSSSRFPVVFSTLLPEDASNCLLINMPQHTSLVSALSSLQQSMRRELPPIMDLPLVRALPQSSSRFPAVFSTLLPENASTTAINYGIKINRVPRETLPLSIVTVPPQARPHSTDEDSLAILNHSEQISHELPDSSRSEIVEVTDVDEPFKTSDIQETSAFKSGCSETESNMSGSKKMKKRSICRRILALFTCCFRKQRQRK